MTVQETGGTHMAVPETPTGAAPAVDSRTVLAHHGKSFNWAGRFLSAGSLDRAARLYAFCRYLDDLADETDDVNQAARDLAAVRADLERGASDRADVADFFDLCSRDPMAIAGALLLTDTIRQDLVPMRVADEAALDVYALGVAGSVGLMMCPVLDAQETERALPFAIDLGMAMQFTNIARDVVEDAERSRLYLPPEWLGGRLEPEDILHAQGDARARAWNAILSLLDKADLLYESARAGLTFLPPRARAAIHVASRVYGGIGTVIRARGPARYWEGRAFTSVVRKASLTTAALAGLPALPGRSRARHNRRLHKAINPTLRDYGLRPGPEGIGAPQR